MKGMNNTWGRSDFFPFINRIQSVPYM